MLRYAHVCSSFQTRLDFISSLLARLASNYYGWWYKGSLGICSWSCIKPHVRHGHFELLQCAQVVGRSLQAQRSPDQIFRSTDRFGNARSQECVYLSHILVWDVYMNASCPTHGKVNSDVHRGWGKCSYFNSCFKPEFLKTVHSKDRSIFLNICMPLFMHNKRQNTELWKVDAIAFPDVCGWCSPSSDFFSFFVDINAMRQWEFAYMTYSLSSLYPSLVFRDGHSIRLRYPRHWEIISE